ncbi:Alpha/Beta hydrolase protein [Ilyonectria destructans]|nr:Alpha/Beta hydrolase protein [Ilyonectria destructans]
MTPPFSNTEKFLLVVRQVCFVLWFIPIALLRSAIFAWARGLPLRLYLICGVLNVVLGVLRPREIQYLCKPTQEAYKEWIRRKILEEETTDGFHSRLSLDIEPLEEGNSSLLWVGDRRRAKKVVLLFHGGGYITPLLPGHLEICWRACVSAGIEMGTEVAVAVLEFTLYPSATYPVQLRQAAGALSHLLSSGFRPQDIIIGGDSAGGNLTGQLLCHLVRPHPEAVPIQLTTPLAASFFISPWLSKYTNDRSYAENGSIDMVSATSVRNTVEDLCGYPDMLSEKNELASRSFPLDMEVPCFEGLDSATSQMYVTVGYNEVFREQCISYVRQVRHFNPGMKVQFDIQEKLAHDFLLVEGLEERSGECMEAMKVWMKSLLIEEV